MQTPLTTTDRVYRSMREMILSGELAAGTRLVQRKLAGRFGTSNIPVVESIRRLERDGLVVWYPNWGAKIKSWTIDDIEGIYLHREALEGIACRLFSERAGELDRVALLENGRKFDTCARDMDAEACDEADIALHLHIVKSARSSTLYHLAENSCLIALAIKNNLLLQRAPEARVGPVGIHDALIAALTSGDSDAAERAGKMHVRGAFQALQRQWENDVQRPHQSYAVLHTQPQGCLGNRWQHRDLVREVMT